MGYAFVMGNCIVCRSLFIFNPVRVPSVVLAGQREPVCRACVERANPLRVAKGMPAIAILPDAYEPCDEQELD